MARGIRSNVTLMPVFSPAQQPQSLSSYDAKTRRNTILIAEIVPTLRDGTAVDDCVPADRYYVHLGAMVSASHAPAWMGTVSAGLTHQQFDGSSSSSGENAQYMQIPDGQTIGGATAPRIMHPFGPFGRATFQMPKNTVVTLGRITFRARFNANADYTTSGIGASSNTQFSSSAQHFIQVLRNSGVWELGSCDGTTISQDSGGTADGSWHDFAVVWLWGELRFYVDGALTITKTTNVPFKPLNILGVGSPAGTIDIQDYLLDWPL